MMVSNFKTWVICLVSFGCFFLQSCSVDSHMRSLNPLPLVDSSVVMLPYHIKAGDGIVIAYMLNISEESEPYLVESGDLIEVKVKDREDLYSQNRVTPDGWLYIPFIDPLYIKKKTINDIRKLIMEAYKPLASDAMVSVNLKESNSTALTFIQTLSQANARGPVYETTVDLDGKANFPQIGFQNIKGKTLEEISNILTEKYKQIVPKINVTARVSQYSDNRVTVLGAVRSPGTFDVQGSISLATSIGLARGWLETAHVEDVVVIRNRGGKVYIQKVDLDEELLTASQVDLIGGDLVYVPNSAITDLNLFVDKFIRRNLPINVNAGANLNLTLDDLR